MELDERIVVHEIEKFPGAAHETRHDPVRVDALEAIGHGARLDQLNHAVRKHFGVDSQVPLLA